MPFLVEAGLIELTVGVLSGWAMVYISDPERVERSRIVAPRRIRQGHLDLLMMGTILIALGAGIPDPSLVAAGLIIFGSWIAPLLFFVIAFRPDLGERRVYRLADMAGFVALSIGYPLLLLDVLTR